ncbi:hypothetical protein [Kitasatospora sp. NPDC056184]|uniref:hypothetical protein n=1 Tax=Kitasatospora sp. NPDC056184 TaxID=3345738 RepID=UPI0035DC8559
MPRRHPHGHAMPPHLRAAAVDCVLLVVEPLLDVLEESAATHGAWATDVMIRMNDAAHAIGDLVNVIAAHLECEGADRKVVRRLLHADDGGPEAATRTDWWPDYYGFYRLPDWMCDQVRGSLAFVTLRLAVLLRCVGRARDARWPARCLLPMAEAMDELDRIVEVLGIMPTKSSATTWNRPRLRADMPSREGRAYLAELLEVPRGPGESACHLAGTFSRGRWSTAEEVDRFRDLALAMLGLLDERLHGHRWADDEDRPLPLVRDAAVACLAGLDAAARGSDLAWLEEDERRRALAAADALTARTAQGLSGGHR